MKCMFNVSSHPYFATKQEIYIPACSEECMG